VPPAPAIEIGSLVKRYGPLTAVDDVSFAVAPGDFFGFLGPNGAGKTTTIQCMVGLATLSSGTIRVMGHDVVSDYRRARRVIGLSPQEFNFDRYLSIRDTLMYSAGYFGIRRAECAARADDLLRRFDLDSKRDLDFTKLSGGMKRRLSIARALIHQPRVLVLDEPTAGVDVELRLELWQFLREANAGGLTIFLTTHYLEEAEQLCNRIAIIDGGRIVAIEDKARLMSHMAGHVLEVRYEDSPAGLPALPGLAVERDGHLVCVRGVPPRDIPAVLARLAEHGAVADVAIKRRSLQDIFLEITGRKPTWTNWESRP